jgi:heme-degrading monooxygenase HmoA
MHVVIFEFWPREERKSEYFDHVAALRGELEGMPGFVSVERFESVTEPGKFVSLSFWDSDEAIARWRQGESHRRVQAAGRAGIFSDYRLRVAAVIRDYGMNERDEAPADSRAVHDQPARGAAPLKPSFTD